MAPILVTEPLLFFLRTACKRKYCEKGLACWGVSLPSPPRKREVPVKMWPAVVQKSKMATKKHMKKNHILLGHCFGACVVIREH